MSRCPEALHGQHGEPNTRGNCPYCGAKISTRKQYGELRGHRSISRKEEEWLDSRERERDLWGKLQVPPDQDPEVDPDPDDSIYD